VKHLDDARRKAVQRLAWLALGVVLWGAAILAKLACALARARAVPLAA